MCVTIDLPRLLCCHICSETRSSAREISTITVDAVIEDGGGKIAEKSFWTPRDDAIVRVHTDSRGPAAADRRGPTPPEAFTCSIHSPVYLPIFIHLTAGPPAPATDTTVTTLGRYSVRGYRQYAFYRSARWTSSLLVVLRAEFFTRFSYHRRV